VYYYTKVDGNSTNRFNDLSKHCVGTFLDVTVNVNTEIDDGKGSRCEQRIEC